VIDWDDLRYFLAIARTRTLSGAARTLHVQQSTMGRRLDTLQSRAGAQLLQKTPSGYVLTAAGESVLAHAERMEAEALAAERAVTGQDVRLAGLVRLTTMETLANEILMPILVAFSEQYPDIEIDMMLEQRVLSLSRREADVALRLGRPEGHELVVRRAGLVAYGLYASAGYLARHGRPDAAAGSPGHRAVLPTEELMQSANLNWTAEITRKASVMLRSNSFYTQVHAAEAGMGIVCLPHYLGRRAQLEPIPAPQTPPRELWLAVHEDTRHTPRIRALTDALGVGLRQQASLLCNSA